MAVSKLPSKKDLLWTNSNPTASFSAQTISMDLSAYGEIEIEFKHSSASESYLYQKVTVPSRDISLFYMNARSPNAEIESREVTATSSGVVFGGGRRAQGVWTPSDDNTRIVPTKIYGIK